MKRQALTEKMIVLGVDGFDPSLAKKFMAQGIMPNLKTFVERGSCREDLVLLGGMPTVTPPMWTTLACGAHPSTHGVTAFFRQHPEKIEVTIYNLDSRFTTAEMLWNVFAEEANKKTLVWHWPGSAWPPTSESPNLHVVDGAQPSAINGGVAGVDWEKVGLAAEDIQEVRYVPFDADQEMGVAGCVITGLEDTVAKENEGSKKMKSADILKSIGGGSKESCMLVLGEDETEINLLGKVNLDVINSPIKPANGWTSAPEDAKEFTILISGGLIKRPALILKNDQGIYDTVAIYKSKKEATPLVVLKEQVFTANYIDEVYHKDQLVKCNRNAEILELAADGSRVRYWLSGALEINNDLLWHPKTLLQDIITNVGVVPASTRVSGSNPEYVEKISLKSWDNYCQWQANCLTYFMENNNYDIIFSHLHNLDSMGHQLWHFAKHREDWGNDETFYQKVMAYMYEQTDRYLSKFIPYLDQGWTMIITSDHGLITEENHPPILAEGCVSVPVMQELGYTVLKKDDQGEDIREIDWSKTRAIAVRGGHIYLNLKGRQAQGIVEPQDQYELEQQIITDLYNYKDPHTGKRVVSIALRNKDAFIIGLGGDQCGDIYFFMEEGFNIIHMDSLSTQKGYFDTSVSPIFIAAGPGIKEGFYTERVIRQVDVAPTMAVLGGVRMPAQNEGSVIHQILTEVF